MEQLPRTRYSQEFRKQSVRFFKEGGLALRLDPINLNYLALLSRVNDYVRFIFYKYPSI